MDGDSTKKIIKIAFLNFDFKQILPEGIIIKMKTYEHNKEDMTDKELVHFFSLASIQALYYNLKSLSVKPNTSSSVTYTRA